MLSNIKKLKLVIVDFDNTLFDTNKVNFISYKKAFNDHSIKFNLMMFKEFAGLNKKIFIKRL